MSPSVLQQTLLSPLTTLLILLLIALYSFDSTSLLQDVPMFNLQKHSYNYKELTEWKKHKKIIFSFFYHKNLLHLIFSLNILWGCLRYVEISQGSMYIFSHSIILGSFSIFLYSLICYMLVLYNFGVLVNDQRMCGITNLIKKTFINFFLPIF